MKAINEQLLVSLADLKKKQEEVDIKDQELADIKKSHQQDIEIEIIYNKNSKCLVPNCDGSGNIYAQHNKHYS